MIGYQSKNKFVFNFPEEIKISKQDSQYIPLSEAGHILNTSRDYTNVLVRRGKLHAIKLGRNWVTTREWIDEYQKAVGKISKDFEISKFQDLKQEEETEFASLREIYRRENRDAEPFFTEREKQLRTETLIPEIKLASRELKSEEKSKILKAVGERFRFADVPEFQKISKQLGILKSLKSWSHLKFSLASGLVVILLMVSLGIASGLINFSPFGGFPEGRLASIFPNVFKNFPSDLSSFSQWLASGFNKSLSFLKSKTPSELAIETLESGKSKLLKPEKTPYPINTQAEAEALDAPFEALAEEGLLSPSFVKTTEGKNDFIVFDNRLSIVETNLKDQTDLINSELSLQKKTIFSTLEALFGIAKLVPEHPISTIVVQGQPATLTTYSIAPQVNTGFDRLSAGYFNLAHDATINGSLTVKSGANLNSLSVSGNTGLTGNTTIGGTLAVTGDTSLTNLTISGTLNASTGLVTLGNASTTNLTVSGAAWINQLSITGTATTTFNSSIASASGDFIIAGDSASNVLLNPYGGNVGIGTMTPNNLFSVYQLIDFNNTDFNTKLGYQAGLNIVSGAQYNTFLGYQAGMSSSTASTNVADTNTAVGYEALFSNASGYGNVALGPAALYSNTSGYQNAALGPLALYSNTSGYNNIALGPAALFSNTNNSHDNIAIGIIALYNNTDGADNTALGSATLYSNISGDKNTALGEYALFSNTIGTNNVGMGFEAGHSITTGNSNTFLGYYAGYNASQKIDAVNSVALGANTYTTASNQMVYGDTNILQHIFQAGDVGIGTTTPTQALTIQGNQFIYGGLGVGLATTTSGAIQTSGDVFVGRNLYVSGDSTVLGGSLTDTLTVNSSINSDLVPNENNVYDLGSSSFYWGNLYIDTINANNISGASTTISGTKSSDFTINSDNASVDQESMNLIFYRGMVPPNAVITWNAATSSKRFEFNQAARFFNESASTTNPILTVQGNTGLTANTFQVLDVSTSTVLFAVNPISQKTTMVNASTTNLTVSDNLWAANGTITNASTTNLTVSGNLWTGASSFLNIGGALLLADGLSGAPSLSFTSDPDTGLYRIDSNRMSFVTGASNALTINNLQRVGIGSAITDPQAQLEVGVNDAYNNTITDVLRLDHYTTSAANNGLGSGILFYGEDAEGAGQNLGRIAAQVEQATSSSGFASYLSFWTVGSTGLLEKMRITGNGQLALATTTVPSGYGANIATSTNIYGDLTISGTCTGCSVNSGTAGQIPYYATNGSTLTATSTIFLSTAGNVGIASTSPSAVLSINISDAAGPIPALNITSATSSILFANSAGYVGIGTTGPGYKLDVVGNLDLSGAVRTIYHGGNILKIKSDSDVYNVVELRGSTTYRSRLDMYTTGDSTIGVSIDPEDMSYFNGGNVGIGTTTPNTNLTIYDATTPSVSLTTGTAGASGWIYGIDTADANKFKIASSTSSLTTNTRLTINGNGYVGIGTTNPTNNLYVQTAIDYGGITIKSTDANTFVGTAIINNSSHNGIFAMTNSGHVWGEGVLLGTDGAYPVNIMTNNSIKMTVLSDGNVGIGIAIPTAKLQIKSAAAGDPTLLYVNDTAGAAEPLAVIADTAHTQVDLLRLIGDSDGDAGGPFYTVFQANGNVGIGTTSPSAKLNIVADGANSLVNVDAYSPDGVSIAGISFQHARGTLASPSATLSNDILGALAFRGWDTAFGTGAQILGEADADWGTAGDSTDEPGRLTFWTTPNGSGDHVERMRIDSNGNVGIGTTTPQNKLVINYPTGTISAGQTKGIIINSQDNTCTSVLTFDFSFQSPGTPGARLTSPLNADCTGQELAFFTAANYANSSPSERMRIDKSGDVGIGTTTPTKNLTVSVAGTVASVAVTNGSLCVDNDGGCSGATAGTIYANAFASAGHSDIAENYYSGTSLEPGEIVQISNLKSQISNLPLIEKATSTSPTIIGVVSTAPGMLLDYDEDLSTGSGQATTTFPVALSGRVPVKVSLENGPIVVGDRISASSVAGVGMRAATSSITVGMALEPFGPSTSSGQVGKILVFVNLGQPQLAAKQGTGDLSNMVTANSDLNMNGFSLLNVKSITGINGLWKIDENGSITAQSVETQKLTVGGGIASGVTIYDRLTAAPKCIYIEGSVIKTSDGACGQTQNTGAPATIIPASDPVSPTTPTTTPPIIEPPAATSTPPVVGEPPVATTTPEINTATTTPETATTTP